MAATVIAAMIVSTGGAAFGAPRARLRRAPAAMQMPAVHGVKPVTARFTKPAGPTSYVAAKTAWPKAASTTLRLGERAAGQVWAEKVPSAVAGPKTLKVDVLDHAAATAAGVSGVLLNIGADRSGTARVGVDYSSFAEAYGGNYASRLRLSRYPDCVLRTPAVAACQQSTPLVSSNDPTTSTVSALVTLTGQSGTVLAADAVPATGEEGGAAGTYTATTLKPSGTWAGGSSTGNFTYTYPLALTQAPSTLVPQIGLSYDSSATDGQTSATEAQASWAGEGWNTPNSFIEQSFQTCSEKPEGSAAPKKIYDQCYDGPIFTLSLNGSSTTLVWDATKKVFKASDADGAVIKHFCTKTTDKTCVAGTGNGSDSYAADWFQVSDRDGKAYSFGMNHLPGWSSTKTATNSVSTEPVYSAHSGDPCYDSAGFSSSVCTMTYRWGLDYTVDAHGNAMAYYYDQDTNKYAKYDGASSVTYVRDQHLTHIDYGFTDGNAYGTVPDRVVFTTSQRCVSDGCGPLNSANASKWPDVPFDLVCSTDTKCKAKSPSYFSTVRLTGISAQQYSADAKKYTTVDSYALTQSTPKTGDGTSPTLWLDQIVHTGADLNGGGSSAAIAMPPVTFTPIQLGNRVDSIDDGLPAFYKYRLATITTETGSQINVTYELADPCIAPVKVEPETNTSSCYPISWTPDGYSAPITDWFKKYVVTKVVQTDPTGGASAQTTSYKYPGGAAWHYDDNELVKEKYRKYGQFRGYGDVVTYLGDGVNDRQSKTESTYYRGMSKNNNTTVVNVTDSQGGAHEDVNELAGNALETSAFLGSDVEHSTIMSYWVSGAAASRARTGLQDLTSKWVEAAESFTREAVTSTGTRTWRYSETDTSYDTDTDSSAFGLATHVYTHTSPVDAKYSTCETTAYAPTNTTNNLAGLAASTEKDSVACGGFAAGAKPSVPGSLNTLTAPASVSRPAQVISSTRNYYDDEKFDLAFPQKSAPTAGNVTMVSKAVDYDEGAFVWQTTSRGKFDTVGRQTDAYDGNGNDTKTGYTADSVGLTIAQSVTNALNQKTWSTLDPQRGSTLTATDANNVVTTQQYDALGRLSSVWLASRPTSAPANKVFSYSVSNSGPTATTTKTLNDESGYQTSTVIYDGLLRGRQTQAMTPQGGRLVTDTFYDSRGWKAATYQNWWDSATTPNTTLVSAADLHAQVPKQDVFTYNSLGDVVIDHNQKNGVEISSAVTVDNGDQKVVFPPTGGAVTATLTDATGRTIEADTYLTRPTLKAPADPFTGTYTISGGTVEALSYTYDGHGHEDSVTQGRAGAGGPTWTETIDLLGQVTTKSDPDAGTTTAMTYDGDGNLLQSTDARGKTVSYRYDALSRKIGQYAGAVSAQKDGVTGNQTAAWVYDNSNGVAGVTNAVGELTTVTSYIGGAEYTQQQLDFTVFGASTGVIETIPASEGGLAGTYTVRQKYSTTTGLALKDVYAAQGGLPAETVNHTYQGVLDLPDTLNGLSGYDQGTTYDAYTQVSQQTLGSGTSLAYVTNTYDPNSGKLKDRLITRTGGSTEKVDEQAYTYDLSGNPTTQTSTRLGATATAETQCFAHDGADQLAGAWTANDDCATVPSQADSSMVADPLGAGSAYWTTWSVDTLGNRTGQVRHAFSGGPATDTTTAYGYDSKQPHTLTSTTTTGAAPATTSYRYDAVGNMTTRNAAQDNQTLSYDEIGRLNGISGSTAGASTFEYGADGALLIQKDPGTTTFYLGNQQFVLNTATGVVTGTRYYDLPGGGQAVRTGTATTSYTFALADEHDTPALYLDNTAQNPTWRQYTPYGESRGPAVVAPDNHGFLNKATDTATGLTIVGVRQYDPVIGRFVTDDPVLEKTDPTQLNGYAYAGNNPVVSADPTGEMIKADGGGGGGAPSIGPVLNSSPGLAVQGHNKKWQAHRVRNKAAQNAGSRKIVTASFDRYSGNPQAGVNGPNLHNPIAGQRFCGEFNCEGTYALPTNRMWTAAITAKEKGSTGVPVRNMFGWHIKNADGKGLFYKDVCATCQGATSPDMFEGGTTFDRGAAGNSVFPNGKNSRFTRTGTSWLEEGKTGASRVGKGLSRANGVLEGAAPAMKTLGVVGTVAAVGYDIYDVATAPPAQRKRVAAEDIGELAGGIGGAVAGAAIAGPVGAIVGGYLGSMGGKALGRLTANIFHW